MSILIELADPARYLKWCAVTPLNIKVDGKHQSRAAETDGNFPVHGQLSVDPEKRTYHTASMSAGSPDYTVLHVQRGPAVTVSTSIGQQSNMASEKERD